MSLNYIILDGQLAQDSEIRYTASGQPILEFSLALEPHQSHEELNYVRVVSRRDPSEQLARQLKKGTQVLVEGLLLMRSYTTRSGFHRKNVEISLENLEILNEQRSGGFEHE